MKEFDDALFDALRKLPDLLKYLVNEKGRFEENDEIHLLVNPSGSCEIHIALWVEEDFDDLDEFIHYMEEEIYKR